MTFIVFLILYLVAGVLIEEVSKRDDDTPMSYIVVLLWPAVFLPAIYNIITNQDIKKGGDTDELP